MAILLSLFQLGKNNWRLVLYGMAILGIFGAGWHVRGLIAESEQKTALETQETLLRSQCADDKKLTEENSRDYQAKVSDLSHKLADAKRLYSISHIMPTSRSPSGINGETSRNEHAGSNAGTPESFIDYAGTCEKLRLQVISMQEFENKVWSK